MCEASLPALNRTNSFGSKTVTSITRNERRIFNSRFSPPKHKNRDALTAATGAVFSSGDGQQVICYEEGRSMATGKSIIVDGGLWSCEAGLPFWLGRAGKRSILSRYFCVPSHKMLASRGNEGGVGRQKKQAVR
jgi:hypothetical protein